MSSEVETEVALERIAGAVLLQAVKDWQLDNCRNEITTFLTSKWGRTVAGLLDLNSQDINEKLLSGDFELVPMRAAYR